METQELGGQAGACDWGQVPGDGPGPGLGEWLTFLPGGAWGLGLRVSLV